MKRRSRLARTNSREWHDAMGAAPDPNGMIGKRAKTWDQMHEICVALMRNWEQLPERVRTGYAFPNPEDR
jgi:hypothetical protein